jgi:TfoX/Sxy family transcriptional regulator of competence genes
VYDGHTDVVGAAERAVRDRVAETLAEIERLEIRPMFSGFGVYVDGLLVAAAWRGAFCLRHREDAHWVYRPVDDELLDDPDLLVPLVRRRVAVLSELPEARPRGRPGPTSAWG